ncbi:hypothetical protein, partial [Klebsiella quasipneumoniae]|uniref:hypothetical protein n=1 Tax=Klebsiella quasipneumoniae TaxID=1463165 RepID=UPI00214F345B
FSVEPPLLLGNAPEAAKVRLGGSNTQLLEVTQISQIADGAQKRLSDNPTKKSASSPDFPSHPQKI